MRKIASFLVTVLLFSCSDDPLPLTPNLVTKVSAYDLANNGNSSDIRVEFKVIDNQNVFEYRIMIIPSKDSLKFNLGIAEALPESHFHEVNPVPFLQKYSIKRLPSNLLDVNGNPAVNGIEYVAAIFVYSTGDRQLSTFSNRFTLKDQGIHVARYNVGFKGEQNCINGFSGPFSVAGDGSYYIDLLNSSGNDYYGRYQCPQCGPEFRGEFINFTVTDSTILNWTSYLMQYCWDLSVCNEGDPCDFYEQGQGVISDELFINVAFLSEDCLCTYSGNNYLVRQP